MFCSDPREAYTSAEALSLLRDHSVETKLVLLSGARSRSRSRRDTAAYSTAEEEEQLGHRGYTQEEAELLNDVDISEESIKKKMKSKNISMTEADENVSNSLQIITNVYGLRVRLRLFLTNIIIYGIILCGVQIVRK